MARTGVTTAGRGVAVARPDVTRCELGVEASAPSVGEALAEAQRALVALRSALLDAGVLADDLRTTATSTWTSGEGESRAEVAHAQLGLRALVRSVDGAGDVVSAALGAAGDRARLHGLQVLVSDPQTAARDARAAAFADARDRAEQFAALAGRGLGELLELTETSGRGTPVGRAFKTMAAEAAMPVDAGTDEIEAHVTTTWAWA
ncbi:SIMPL domain-containing protein [Flavimobilis sp. GY10621]|uniref:SIMPL domain-containing protein n=1 Tax=Flavimobilis rhizosphaerae TaxID=2775421 RepID=A0ABR9DPH2_9MICO|nr:SIMPL domain-containing protein [Flavimobilis rhizosphaerae]MBD9698232.1 SIMPL domain-containing protein [Flavimobilis rhizosphaerae]